MFGARRLKAGGGRHDAAATAAASAAIHQERIASIVLLDLNAGLLVMVAFEQFLEHNDASDRQRHLADDQRFAGNDGQRL